MQTRRHDPFITIRTEGAILPTDLLQRIAEGDKNLGGLLPEDFHLAPNEKINEAVSRSWSRLITAWAGFKDYIPRLREEDVGTTITRNRWLLPLFQELGYGQLQTTKAVEMDGKSYPISHGWQSTPIHLVGFRVALDRRSAGIAGAARTNPHGLLQEFLNRSDDHLWGFVSNGLKLRILRDNVTLTRQAYVEFDLEAMMEGEVYSDFVILWLLSHQSRVEAERPEQCWLEKWSQAAQEQGTRALDRLRDGVQEAIEALGRGFLEYRGNSELREKLQSGELAVQDYYRQLLRVVYRLLFMFVSEDRELLLDPKAADIAQQMYAKYYSTTRLRGLAENRRGTHHSDLWKSLSLVFKKLSSDEGYPELALPALGSFLWSDEATPDLDDCRMANNNLLDTIRSLAFIVDGKTLRSVDFKNLGSAELGSVYESLLELHPEISVDTGRFDLSSAAGHERKTTGSYYTPASLVNCLLDSALDPVLDETSKKDNPEEAILDLKICDPACGSGHFLIAAAHRVAKRLAEIRTGDEEPSPEETRTALRDVIGRCIYGVDINPMAVELCKISLWMEAVEPGKPLSFLEHRIQCGNSLLGATPTLLEKGIPDEAFKPIEGDDKEYCKELKKRNKEEREKWQTFIDFKKELQPWERLGDLATGLARIDDISDDSIEGIKRKQDRYAEYVRSQNYLFGRLWADAWCVAFVCKKLKTNRYVVTEGTFREIEANPYSAEPSLREEISRLSNEYGFFHWHIAFPHVLTIPEGQLEYSDGKIASSENFDLIIGNPPWEMVQAQEVDFFYTRDREISESKTRVDRIRAISELQYKKPALHKEYNSYIRRIAGERHFLKTTKRYPLSTIGRINSYKIFLELGWSLLNRAGHLGMIVPSAIAFDDYSVKFFSSIMEAKALKSFYDFENRKGLFPAVDGRMRFSLATLGSKAGSTYSSTEFLFFAQTVTDIHEAERRIQLSHKDMIRFNPNTHNCPIFRTKRDLDICSVIYKHIPVFILESESGDERLWDIQFGRIFNLSLESDSFTSINDLDWEIKIYGDCWLPLYDGKMITAYNHRGGSVIRVLSNRVRPFQSILSTNEQLVDPLYMVTSQYYMKKEELCGRLGDHLSSDWILCAKDVTSATNERTVIAAIIPFVPTSLSLRILVKGAISGSEGCCFLGLLNSFIYDWLIRLCLGGLHLQDNITKQTATLEPIIFKSAVPWDCKLKLEDWVKVRVMELSYTSYDIVSFVNDCGLRCPPFIWDDNRRFLIRCELDAAYFHLYGIERDDVDYIMETFPIVKRKDEKKYGEYRTKRVILEIYDAMAESIRTGKPYQTILDPPPADPSLCHPPRERPE